MSKIFWITGVMILMLSGVAPAVTEFVVADFDRGEPPNNIGGDYGTWNHDASDPTQGCYFFAEPDDFRNPQEGYCVRLDYDVQSKNAAFNGFWMKLKDADVSEYDTLTFWVKGTKDGKFTSRFKLELKDGEGHRVIYPIEGVTSEWQEMKIDLKGIPSAANVNWKKMAEFVLVFDDLLATYKEGTVFVDHVVFKKGKA